MIDQLSKAENAVMEIFKESNALCDEGRPPEMILINFIKKNFNSHEFDETMDSLIKKGYLYKKDGKSFFFLSKKGSESD